MAGSRARVPAAQDVVLAVAIDDIWGAIVSQRFPILKVYEDAAAEGVKLLRAGSPGARRMRETQEFYAFLREVEALPRITRIHKLKLERAKKTDEEGAQMVANFTLSIYFRPAGSDRVAGIQP